MKTGVSQALMDELAETMRLFKLSNYELAQAFFDRGTKTELVVTEMICRLCPEWAREEETPEVASR